LARKGDAAGMEDVTQLMQAGAPEKETGYISEARLRLAQKDYDAALDILNKLLEKNPDSVPALLVKSDALAAFDKALELDPQYEPAMVNKAMTETLAEGEKMDNKVKTVEYYKDFLMQNRSYVQYFLDESLRTSDRKGSMPVTNGRAISP